MSDLQPCTGCKRHIRIDESACPFCSVALGEDFRARATVPNGALRRPLTRAALLFASATAIAACTSGTGTTSGGYSSGEPAYGGPPIDPDSGDARDATSDGPSKFDGPVALYGPAPVDAGDG